MRTIIAALLTLAASAPALAQAPAGKVTVVTSFAKDVTDPYKKAFEKAFPGASLEVQNRNTNSAVKFLEETRSANATDLKLSIHPHPTLTETMMESAEVFFGQATHVYRPKR